MSLTLGNQIIFTATPVAITRTTTLAKITFVVWFIDEELIGCRRIICIRGEILCDRLHVSIREGHVRLVAMPESQGIGIRGPSDRR